MSHQENVDWQAWLTRWDDQQAGYLPDREEQFATMLDVVEQITGPPARLVDLACGPGSISARSLRRWPAAKVVGVDLDPFLLEIARQTVTGARFEATDLRENGWDAVLGDGLVDAVLSATALHWLEADRLGEVARDLARRIRPGGVFLNADTMRLGPTEVPRLDAVAVRLRNEIWESSHASGVEDWASWWDAARAEPAFAELLERREAAFGQRRQGREITLRDSVEALQKAGFAEVAVLGQVADKHLLAAIR
ncbi:class I SAM-dependent methyltransferase [Kribbella deserti]|uniref:Class I SAM-dependent methyltransferase n=1 Tax=Kribbella deserti TaxID=1926257 RepID=A0ABV6QPT1_9ACTN